MSASDPQGQAEHWLNAFDQALKQGDIATAVTLFEADCYWRDLVSFTWNITTAEGQPAVKDLLDHSAKVQLGRGLANLGSHCQT